MSELKLRPPEEEPKPESERAASEAVPTKTKPIKAEATSALRTTLAPHTQRRWVGHPLDG